MAYFDGIINCLVWDEQEEEEEMVDEEVANEQSVAQLVNFVAVEHIYISIYLS